MRASIDEFLSQTAKRGSWYGGGSAAAMTCALAAALLEKLLSRASTARRVHVIRRQAVSLIDADAKAFSSVIRAYYREDKRAVRETLKRAIAIPVSLYRSANRLLAIEAKVRPSVPAKYRSDLDCVVALAAAAKTSSRSFVDANLAWLGDPAYSRRVRRQLQAASGRRTKVATRGSRA